jgi:lipooligosaccharide transport system ATP-binding protein
MRYALEVEGLSKTLGGNRVVDELSFYVEPGECLGIIGPNGAGKTTTIKLCLGLATPGSGMITALGEPIPERAAIARQRIGVVSQFDSLDPDFTVEENLRVFGRYFSQSAAASQAHVQQLLEFAALQAKANAKITELSGGMKRRLSLARALVNDPALMFLDEPTTGLDPQARHVMWERLQRLAQQGKAILLTTHFMDEAERLCHRLLVLDKGRAIATGTPRALIAEHLEPEVIELYGTQAKAALQALAPQLQGQRVEHSGETSFIYTHNAKPLLTAIESLHYTASSAGLRYIHRPGNLEDLFLKLTGRQLRDE